MMCQRIGLPPISTIGLGLRVVSSLRREPRPPARITAFTAGKPNRGSLGWPRMIVDHLRSKDRGERVERSARLRWIGREFPPPEQDASPLLPLAVLLAMTRHEDVHVDAEVCSRLLRRSGTAQRTFAAWNP